MRLTAFRRRRPEPSAREQVDIWLAWMVLDGKSPHTIDGYRQTTNKFLDRWPELTLSQFTDEHILGFIEEANLASRQQRRGCFSNLFGWAYRTRRVPFNPMHHIPTYKQAPQPPIEVFTEAECKVLCALPDPDGTLMAVLLGSGIREAEARSPTVRRIDFEHAELHVVEGAKGGSFGVIPLEHRLVQRLARAADEAVFAAGATREELGTLATPAQLAEIEQELERLHATEAEWRGLVAEREAIVARAHDARRRRDDLLVRANELLAKKGEAADKADALEIAEQPTCQTCGQTVDGEARARAIDAYRTAAEAFERDASELADQVVAIELPEIPKEIAAPTVAGVHIEQAKLGASRTAAQRRVDQQQRARLEERLVALQVIVDARPAQPQLAAALTVCDEKLHALDALGDAVDIATLEQQGLTAKHALDAAKVAFDAARTQRARLEERLAQIATAEEQIAAAEAEGATLAGDIEVVAQLDRAFSPDGIPALIVENSAIPYLETEATRILADLGTSFRVELRTQAALKSGDGVRDTLDVIIQTQESERPYETFSGGERTRLNLALRIALARLLAHRRGAESRLLCIDEPEFLDEQGTAALVDVLRGLQDDFDRVYLISHVPALRDSFDEVLTVVKGDDGRSSVVEQGVFEPVPA